MVTDYIKRGDFLELMRELPNGSIDMILCDLPYGVTKNKWDIPIPFSKLWKEYIRIIKPNGIIALFGQGKFFAELVKSNIEWFRYDLIWDKVSPTGFLNARRMPLRRREQIAIFYKKLPKYNPQFTYGKPLHSRGKSYLLKDGKNQNYGTFKRKADTRAGCTEKFPTSIITLFKNHGMPNHPTEKPVELLEYLIKTYTDENEIVLDNCIGSGSTAVACIKTNRHYIGYELEKEYCDIAKQRISQALAEASYAQ